MKIRLPAVKGTGTPVTKTTWFIARVAVDGIVTLSQLSSNVLQETWVGAVDPK